MIIGLTGGMGSGKSYAASIIEEQGFLRVDADAVSRGLTKDGSPMLEKLAKHFGEELVTDGKLDRKALAEIVFNNKEKLKELNELMHGEILKICLDMMTANPDRDVIFDVPLLFETGWDVYCDKTLVICTDEEIRLLRVGKRDGMSEEETQARMRNQLSDKERIERADAVVYNNGTKMELRINVLKALEMLYNN